MKSQHNRFKDAPWYPKEDVNILLGGAGGIGSWTAVLLSRAGFKPIVYDFDILEDHNIGGQLFPKKLIGSTKVAALTAVVRDFSDEEIITMEEKIDSFSPSNIYCISAFDNMEARHSMFNSWLIEHGSNPDAIFIDGRLTAEQLWIFCVKGGDSADAVAYQELYRKDHLFLDSEVEDAPCTMKQTSHAAAMIAAHIVAFFTNHYTNVVEKSEVRSVPFKWEYFIPMDLLDLQT